MRYYQDWLLARRILPEIATDLGMSVPTLRMHFDALPLPEPCAPAPYHAINLVIDATFFGRAYGYLCFSDTRRVIYFREIKVESIAALHAGLQILNGAGYRFKSFTLDGKRGFIQTLQSLYPHTPIQMCQFHQKAIIRRYVTNNPKTACGQDLKELMTRFGIQDPQEWIFDLFACRDKHKDFLAEKNERGEFTHKRLRSAFRSLKTNLPYLFVCDDIPAANIPNTTNHLEGSFAHLKEKIKIHRGLKQHRKKKAIQYLLYWS
ncbi:MAG: hypothetical protein H6855_02590 [Rhodospirillales bacterium]|nr:hypothetical protein [Rhodospirillales bacterium]MCB9964948.1 hypothetical protein [Rhodospirillales bacterium]MCB9964954.1 hypothetical protein [Rhodospirillales bacterium]MCB9973454.1 hypothetical protein [Rhodospirillales bacterium]MCB9980486.1 hypothetical protein [Rhodospirillales bacterium]